MIRYRSEVDARAVSSALSPDNIQCPEGLLVETCRDGRTVISTVTCTGGIERFGSTLDDLLSCTLMAERAIAALRAQTG